MSHFFSDVEIVRASLYITMHEFYSYIFSTCATTYSKIEVMLKVETVNFIIMINATD